MPKRIFIAGLLAVMAAAVVTAGAVAGGAGTSQKKPEFKRAIALFAVMSGRKEVDAQGNRRAGDHEGVGSFTAMVSGSKLCYGYTVAGIGTPVAAHIHKGRPNQAGAVVLPLATLPTAGDPGTTSDCTDIPAELAAAILKNPGKYYVNVHTAEFPGGAVRGQLHRRSG
jgi:CHRD domain-containing protein